jgi:hypothetical protein
MMFINISTRKVKAKKKPGWREAEAEYEQWLKKHGAHKSQRKQKASEPYVTPTEKTYVRETQKYPSLVTSSGSTAKVEANQYTGDYFIGIATMHKSNLVPVGRGDDAKSYATMRRS